MYIEESDRVIGDNDTVLREPEALLAAKDAERHATVPEPQEEQSRLQEQLEELKQELKRRDFKLQSVTWQLREWERREKQLIQMQEAFREVEAVSRTGSYRLVRALSSPARLLKRRVLPTLRNKRAGVVQRLKRFLNGTSHQDSLGLLARQDSNHDWLTSISESELRTIKDLFDAEWYLRQNQDVARTGLDPLEHYFRVGAIEGRSPHALFDPKFYLKTYPEVAIAGQNLFQHYLTKGWRQGFKPNPKFDPLFYVSMYPDIALAGVEPLTHFIVAGLREGRATSPEEIHLEPFEAEFEISRDPSPAPALVSDVKAIAFYLPQFHPIPENDEWWGTGFTEWTNVRRGEPQFKDHYQPHVPHGLNYYDLREPHELERQIELARNYGLFGFCFYYYWFAGKVLLEMPLLRMLERGEPDFPFCLCWANENWTRRWDGQESEILIAQRHTEDDDLAFIKNIERYLLHKNYIRVDGKPLLIVYQPSFFPDAEETAARWREYFRAQGHGELYLASMQTFAFRKSPEEYGFDAVIQFPPHCNSSAVTSLVEGLDKSFAGQVYDYNQTKWHFIDELQELSLTRNIYPGVMPSWDNTARRRNNSSIWINSSPESYYDWLRKVVSHVRKNKAPDERLVFINAWNEWAEGCHLEPDQLFSHAWLNATSLALQTEGAAQTAAKGLDNVSVPPGPAAQVTRYQNRKQ